MNANRILKFLAMADKEGLTVLDTMAVNAGIPPTKLKYFWPWCFGEDYKKIHPKEFTRRWNERHAKQIMIFPTDSVGKSIRVMAEIYLKLNH